LVRTGRVALGIHTPQVFAGVLDNLAANAGREAFEKERPGSVGRLLGGLAAGSGAGYAPARGGTA